MNAMIRYASFVGCLIVAAALANADQSTQTTAVSYSRHIAPILRQNCLACHRDGQAEGGLSLEGAVGMGQGGDSGELIDLKQPSESLLLDRITNTDEIMPPDDNSVGAKRLSAEEVDLIRHWIEAGAKVDEKGADAMDWEPIAESIRTSLALAASPDAQFIAVGRANRVELIDQHSGMITGTLADQSLSPAGVADVDFIGAIAISPLGEHIATGGYKSVRIWRREKREMTPLDPSMPIAGQVVCAPDQQQVAFIDPVGDVQIWSRSNRQTVKVISPVQPAKLIDWSVQHEIAVIDHTKTLRFFQADDAAEIGSISLSGNVAMLERSVDGSSTVVVHTDGTLRLLRQKQPLKKSSAAAIKDATTAIYLNPTTLFVGTQAGTVHQIDLEADQVTQTFAVESLVTTLTVNDPYLFAGTDKGTVITLNLQDGTQVSVAKDDWQDRLYAQRLGRSLTQTEGHAKRLEGQTPKLQANLDREKKSLDEVTKAFSEAEEKLKQEVQKRIEVDQQLSAVSSEKKATEQFLTTSQADVEAYKRSIAGLDMQLASDTKALAPLKATADQANQAVSAAEAQVASAMKQLEQAKQQAAQAMQSLEKAKLNLKSKQQQQQEATTKLAALEKQRDESTKRAAEQKQKIDQLEKSLQERDKAVAGNKENLANRKQALESVKEAHQLAADRIPQHQRQVLVRSLQIEQLKRQIEALQTSGQSGHPVTSIALLDSNRMSVLDAEGTLRDYDILSGQPTGPALKLRHDMSTNVAGKPAIVSSSNDSIWVTANTSLLSIDHPAAWRLHKMIGGLRSDVIPDRVTALAFSPDGESLAIGSGVPSRSGMVAIADVDTGSMMRRLPDVHSDAVLALAYSPAGDILASGSADKSIRLIDYRQSNIIKSLDGHTHHVLSLDWRQDGQTLASGGADKNIKLWDVQSGQQQRSIGVLSDEVSAVRFVGADQAKFASVTLDGQLRVHQTSNGTQIKAAGSGELTYTMDVSADGETILTCGQSGTLRRWNTEDLSPRN